MQIAPIFTFKITNDRILVGSRFSPYVFWRDLRAPWVGKNLLYRLSASTNSPWVLRGEIVSIRSIFIGRRRWMTCGRECQLPFSISRRQLPSGSSSSRRSCESLASLLATLSVIRRAGCRVDFYMDVPSYWNAISWNEIYEPSALEKICYLDVRLIVLLELIVIWPWNLYF